jgi:transcriptional regulator GlxA family with amidase domain
VRLRSSNRSQGRPRTVAFLVVPPVQELDLVGPLEVFTGANRVLAGRGPGYSLRIVSTEHTRAVAGNCGLSLVTEGHYSKLEQSVDTLFVIGSPASIGRCRPPVLRWLEMTAGHTHRVASVCVGAFFLAQAGLLRHKRATTHWAFADELQRNYPEVLVDPAPIWVRDGNIFTSAGVTAGIDLALAMVEQDHGPALALDVARGLVVFLRRPGNQAQFSASLSSQASERATIRDLQTWMAEHLREDLRIEALARRAAMSSRHFARVFAQETGTTPAKFVESLRLEAARRCLEESTRGQKEISHLCGFGSAEVMRRTFLARLHVTPGVYRRQFQTGTYSRGASRQEHQPQQSIR